MREAFEANGIPKHTTYFAEGHIATSRGGDPSALHAVTSAVTHPANSNHAFIGSATPHKNDEAEIQSMAALIDPDKYGDTHQFMQNFGQNTQFNPDALRREMSHAVYSAKIDPAGVDRTDTDNPSIERQFMQPARKVAHGGPIKLEGEHKALVDGVTAAYDKARKARERGEVDVASIRKLSPDRFEGKPPAEHEGIAKELQGSLGIIREAAMRKAVNGAPAAINQKVQQLTAVLKHDVTEGTWTDRAGNVQRGKPSIVFTDRAEEAHDLADHLKSQGLRAAVYHGGLDGKARAKVIEGFQPPKGRAREHDVLVMTSAGEAGINLQDGKVLHNMDVPQTFKSHQQRAGRAYRQGQQGNVEIHNWHTDTPYEQNALRRLRRKEGLGAVQGSPLPGQDESGVAFHHHAALARKHEAREVA